MPRTLFIFFLLFGCYFNKIYAQPTSQLNAVGTTIFEPMIIFIGDSVHAGCPCFAWSDLRGIWGKINDTSYKLIFKFDQDLSYNTEVDTIAHSQDSFEIQLVDIEGNAVYGILNLDAYANRKSQTINNTDTTFYITPANPKIVIDKYRFYNSELYFKADENDTSYFELNLYFRRYYSGPSILQVTIFKSSEQGFVREFILEKITEECWILLDNQFTHESSIYCTHPREAHQVQTCSCAQFLK